MSNVTIANIFGRLVFNADCNDKVYQRKLYDPLAVQLYNALMRMTLAEINAFKERFQLNTLVFTEGGFIYSCL